MGEAQVRERTEEGQGGASGILSARQREVLEAALRILSEKGDALTMSRIARGAKCSKETLYNWFGDREGTLTAMVRYQASKVRLAPVTPDALTAQTLRASLESFATDWLTVLTSERSIALNRVAIGRVATGRGADRPEGLGGIVLANGPLAMRARVVPLLEAGQAAGLLPSGDPQALFRRFFGLVVADTQIRALLGDALPSAEAIHAMAAQAVTDFLALSAETDPPAGSGENTTI